MTDQKKPSGGTAARFLLGLPLAGVATAAIFVFMSGIIESKDVPPPPPDKPPLVLPQVREPGPTPNSGQVDKVDVTPVDPPETTRPILDKRQDGPVLPDGTPVTPKGEKGTGFEIPSLGGPIVTFPPAYPARCMNKGVEGSATVQFDVLANGRVVNARFVSATHSCFKDRDILRTVEKWKYRATGDGDGIAQRGLLKSFSFVLQ